MVEKSHRYFTQGFVVRFVQYNGGAGVIRREIAWFFLSLAGAYKLSVLCPHRHRGSGRLNLCAHPTLYRAHPFVLRDKRMQKRAFSARLSTLWSTLFQRKRDESG